MNDDVSWIDSWTWNQSPVNCIKMTHNAYACIVIELEEAIKANEELVKRLMKDKTCPVSVLREEMDRGLRLKFTIDEIKNGERYE